MKQLIELSKKLNIEYIEKEPMKNHTTFKVGGNASLVLYPKNEKEIASLIKCANDNNIRVLTIGNGSNLLVSDEGIDGAVIILDKHFDDVLVEDDMIIARAGAPLIKVCKAAYNASLTGLEFAYGIPGSCGGAAFMNAGAYGGEMKDVLIKCDHINKSGDLGSLSNEELKLSYRHSAYYDNGSTITAVHLKLKHGKKEEIKEKMDDFLSRRKERQPLEYPSAGSTFKRPEGHFAGQLIEECNLKGKSVGGAKVSEKHAGFIINTGSATCNDILELCAICSDTVFKEKGVKLEMEIRVTK